MYLDGQMLTRTDALAGTAKCRWVCCDAVQKLERTRGGRTLSLDAAQVCRGAEEAGGVLYEVAGADVAGAADDTSDDSGSVVVVDHRQAVPAVARKSRCHVVARGCGGEEGDELLDAEPLRVRHAHVPLDALQVAIREHAVKGRSQCRCRFLRIMWLRRDLGFHSRTDSN